MILGLILLRQTIEILKLSCFLQQKTLALVVLEHIFHFLLIFHLMNKISISMKILKVQYLRKYILHLQNQHQELLILKLLCIFFSSTNYTSFKIDDLQLPSTGFYTLVFHYSSIGSDCSLDVFIDKYDDSNTSYYNKVTLPSNTSSIIRQELEFNTNAIPMVSLTYDFGFSSSGTNCSCYIDNIQVY